MGIFNRFPYSSTHEMNLDFMLGKAQEINEQLQTVQTGMQEVQTGLSQIDEQTERATTAAATAEAARDESQQNERDAFAWTEQAEQHADRAEAALSQLSDEVDRAEAAADRAEAAASAASISASAASNSANIASQNAATAAQQAANAQLSAQSAQGALNQATVAAHNAQTSAVSAADAAALASGYNSQAATSATNAATSATNAATSAASVLEVEQNVQDLVESIPEDYSTLSNDVNDLKSALTVTNDQTLFNTSEIQNLNMDLYGETTIKLEFTHGRYIENGYNFSRKQECVNTGYIAAGVYDFPAAPTGYEFCIYYYDSDSQGTILYSWTTSAKNKITIERNAKITFRNESTPSTALTYSEVENIAKNYKLKMYTEPTRYANGISTDVLKGLYIPNETGWVLERIRCDSTWFRLGVKLSDNTLIINGFNDVGTEYSDTVQTLINNLTGEVIGYYVLHYTGTDYETTAQSYAPVYDNTASLDANPIIKEYLNREENLVLIGDSIFGFGEENQLAPILRRITDKKVFNCAFGGCTMAERSGNAANYNVFSFVGIADSIYNESFSPQQAKIGLDNAYPYRYADLASVDWTKPTTIFVDYMNNDITSDIPIGDLWEYTDIASDWDKTKYLGAMIYGLSKIITKYPHIRIVFFTAKWRYLTSGSSSLPPYVYENGLHLKASDYNEALKNNAERLGVSVYDFSAFGGSNAFNKDYMMIRGASHFTIEGYVMFAELLKNLVNSPLM